jgi:predicted cupin superfamily sugar epimerase
VDAAEIWHFYRGAPLELKIGRERYALGPDIDEAQVPQLVVPPGAWQSARSLGDYTLVGCTVAPGFEFSKFEMAPDGFEP